MHKIAIVTGASSGIGKITSQLLVENNYFVYAIALPHELGDLQAENIEPVGLDVTDEQAVHQAVTDILNAHGQIDLLVNGASFSHLGAIECVPLDAAKKQFDVNLFGYARMIQAVLPSMRARRSGHIINISSAGGQLSSPAFGWYCASKFAVEGMSDALRNEVHQFGIKVVLIQPGLVKTPFLAKQAQLLEQTPHPEDYRNIVDVVHRAAGDGHDGKGVEPVVIAKAILKAALSTNPPPRIALPLHDAKLPLLIKRLVSDRLFDRLMRKMVLR